MELMAEWQWKRWDAVARLGAGKLTLQEAARMLRLSVRQVRRVRRAVERVGRAGLRHGNAGQVPANKLRAAVRNRIPRPAGRAGAMSTQSRNCRFWRKRTFALGAYTQASD